MTCKVPTDGAFLHVPKTGGMWVCEVLERHNLYGIGLGHEHTPTHFEKWAFCVLRHPKAWWLSLWQYRCDVGFPYMDGQHPLYPIDQLRSFDPEEFFNQAMRETPLFCSELFEQYAKNSTYILKTECLKTQLQMLGSRVGWPILNLDIPRINESIKRELSPEALGALQRLADGDKKAFELWSRADQEWATYEI